jgi:hypothetical protein
MVAVCVACCAGVAVAEQPSGRELFDKATGVAVTLPEGWEFFVDHVSLRATSGDERAMVVMMATEKGFEQELMRLERTVGQRHFENVKVDQAVILMGEDRGGLEGAVAMRGTAVHREDGQPVEFAATLVKAGDAGELIFGAWKDPRHAQVVQEIVDSVHVRLPEMEAGLRLTDKKTGATITIPDQWSVYAYRTGLQAFDPDRRAMTLIVRSDGDFEGTSWPLRARRDTAWMELRSSSWSWWRSASTRTRGCSSSAPGRTTSTASSWPRPWRACASKSNYESRAARRARLSSRSRSPLRWR